MREDRKATESMGRQESKLTKMVCTHRRKKAEVLRIIDEYDSVSIVLRYKAAMMPEDLVQELARQNDINREIITMLLPS